MTITDQPDTRPETATFTVSREAMDVMKAASERCLALRQHFGVSSKEYTEAVHSWQRQITMVFASPMSYGNVRVMKDGPLSLFVAGDSGFVFGLIFHGDKRRCTREGCKAYINDDGTIYTYNADDFRCEQHIASYGRNAPQPGTWSFHS